MSAAEPSWIPLIVVDGGGLLSSASATVNEEACSILAAESPVPSKLALVALDGPQVAAAVVGTEPPPASVGAGSTVTAWLWTKPLRKVSVGWRVYCFLLLPITSYPFLPLPITA